MTNHTFDTTEPTNLNPVQPEVTLDDLAPDAEVPEGAPDDLGNTIIFTTSIPIPEEALSDPESDPEDVEKDDEPCLLDDLAEAQAIVSDLQRAVVTARSWLALKTFDFEQAYAARYMERLGDKLTEEARKQDATLHTAEQARKVMAWRNELLRAECEFDSARRARDVALLAWKEVYNHPQSYQSEL